MLTLAQFLALARRYAADQERQDYRTGLICSLIANIHRNPKKRSQPFSPDDFMPGKHNKPIQTPGQKLHTVKLLNAAFGGDEVVKDA
jgi:hypothetical protein